jgi:uncharacterized protein (TIGR02246 family)
MIAIQQTVGPGPADELAIRDLTRHLADSWNGHDGAAYAAVFTEDSDYIAYDGTHLKGRSQNADHHQRLFDTVLRGTRLVFDQVGVRFVTPDVAVMHGDGSVLMPWHAEIAAAVGKQLEQFHWQPLPR